MPELQQILLADDNDANRLVAQTILERSGYEITPARNGEQALGLAKIITFDLIILDIMMPVMDGMRALRRLRREVSLNQDTTAFALTAYSNAEDQQRYLEAGFDYVLAKPLRPGDIEIALTNYKSGRPMPTSTKHDETSLMTTPLIDESLTQQIMDIADQARLEAIQSRFWNSIIEQCRIIESSLHEAICGDEPSLSQFRRAIHAIKSASAAVGLARVSFISRHLQNAPTAEIPNLMKLLSNCLMQSRPALKKSLSRTGQFNIPMEMCRHDESKASHDDQNHCAAI